MVLAWKQFNSLFSSLFALKACCGLLLEVQNWNTGLYSGDGNTTKHSDSLGLRMPTRTRSQPTAVRAFTYTSQCGG